MKTLKWVLVLAGTLTAGAFQPAGWLYSQWPSQPTRLIYLNNHIIKSLAEVPSFILSNAGFHGAPP